MLSECCKAEILFDASNSPEARWVTWEGEAYSISDNCICAQCNEENPKQLKEEAANDN